MRQISQVPEEGVAQGRCMLCICLWNESGFAFLLNNGYYELLEEPYS